MVLSKLNFYQIPILDQLKTYTLNTLFTRQPSHDPDYPSISVFGCPEDTTPEDNKINNLESCLNTLIKYFNTVDQKVYKVNPEYKIVIDCNMKEKWKYVSIKDEQEQKLKQQQVLQELLLKQQQEQQQEQQRRDAEVKLALEKMMKEKQRKQLQRKRKEAEQKNKEEI